MFLAPLNRAAQTLWILNHFITPNEGCSFPFSRLHVTVYFQMKAVIYEMRLSSGKWVFPMSCLYWCFCKWHFFQWIRGSVSPLKSADGMEPYICCTRISRILNVSFPLNRQMGSAHWTWPLCNYYERKWVENKWRHLNDQLLACSLCSFTYLWVWPCCLDALNNINLGELNFSNADE